MAHLLHRPNDQIEWHRIELPDTGAAWLHPVANPAPAIALTPAGDPVDAGDLPDALALIVPWAQVGRVHHVHFKLVEQTFRNGEPVPLSDLAVLSDRDCISYCSDGMVWRVFYDAFTRPQARPYAGQPLNCAYCRQPVTAGVPAVRCPGCATVFHQADEDGCWLASDRCPNCGYPTALDRPPTWVPQGFEDEARDTCDDTLS